MASFFSSVRQGFGRSNKSNERQQQQAPAPPQQPSSSGSPNMSSQQPPQSYTQNLPPMPHSPSLAPSITEQQPAGGENQSPQPPSGRKPPYFFREEYANLIVKGNFMTLAARPKLVEEGEWLAHQVVEQYRLLDGMIQIIRVQDERTGRPICNPDSCPTMSAAGHTYTWLDNNKKPIKIPAYSYIQLVQKWIIGKINDPALFPTDTSIPSQPSSTSAATYASGGLNTPHADSPIPAPPTSLNAPVSQLAGREWVGKTSGFPENFKEDIKSIYRQMMRCYAHLYHGHWLDPFWHLNAYKELNTCFIHFVNVGKQFDLLGDKEMEPMQPLVSLWLQKGLLPAKQEDGAAPVAGAAAAGGQQKQAEGQGQAQAAPAPTA